MTGVELLPLSIGDGGREVERDEFRDGCEVAIECRGRERLEVGMIDLCSDSRVEDGEEVLDEGFVDGVFHELFMGGNGVPVLEKKERCVSSKVSFI